MATVYVLNPNFTDNGSNAFDNWTIGSNGAWTPSDYAPFIHGVDGFFLTPSSTGNTLFQDGVFTDFGTGAMHRLKVNVEGVIGTTKVTVMFGTNTATTITSAGIQYITASAATNARLTFNILSGGVGMAYAVMADVDPTYAAATTYVQPAYNPFYFVVTSTKTSQPNFQYVFDIFTGSTGVGLPQDRIKLLPRPVLANCVFSPARVLESYVSYDLNIQNITGATNSNNNITPYTILFGEEYGDLSTGTTIYSGMSFISGYTFNGVQQYDQLQTWKYTDYALSASTSKFLTYQPRSGVSLKNTTDRGTLTYMQNIYAGSDATATTQHVTVYHLSGGTSTFDFPVTTIGQIVHIPSGIWNLNNNAFSGSVINPATDYKYTIEMWYLKAPISEALTYNIDPDCSMYQTVRMQFLNPLGGWDYVNMNLVSRKYIDVKRNEYKRVLPYDYVVGERGRTILDIDASHSYVATTDWFNQNESNWMEDLLKSNEVYVISDTGVATPIIIENNSEEMKKNINPDTRLINWEFRYSDAFKIDTQRG